jgi:hypothetical protein
MTREDPPLRIRLPEDLKVKIQALAVENRRSMNAEIVSRLSRSIAEDVERTKQALDAIQASPRIWMEKQLIGVETKLEARIDELEARLAKLEQRSKTA